MYKLSPGLKDLIFVLGSLFLIYMTSIVAPGCAQIISPTGGPKDTVAPRLLSSNPANGSTNFKGNRITLNFDEYVTIEQLQENLLVSPTPSNTPYIDYKLRTVIIKLKDSLEENTTYTINFGNAIRDLNEGNPLKDYRFVFSTGPVIDSLTLNGKVILAETGETDSTMFALLYKNMDDSAVIKRKPSFISRVDANGNFHFENLPPGSFHLYALKDRDNGRTYNNLTETFGFLDTPVVVGAVTVTPTLYAYAERSPVQTATSVLSKDKNLKFSSSVSGGRQELIDKLNLVFNYPLTNFDKQKIQLTDTLYVPQAIVNVALDSTRKIVTVDYAWKENADYLLIIDKDFAKDSTGRALLRSDTLDFKVKSSEDYGSLNLRFINLPKEETLVLQFTVGADVVFSTPLTGNTWQTKLFKPGDYKLRILFDKNKNGKWDPGSYSNKIQPERVISIPQVIKVGKNFENEMEIRL